MTCYTLRCGYVLSAAVLVLSLSGCGSPSETYRQYRDIGRRELARENFTVAEAAFSTNLTYAKAHADALGPNSIGWAHFDLAELYGRQQRIDEAVAAYDAALTNFRLEEGADVTLSAATTLERYVVLLRRAGRQGEAKALEERLERTWRALEEQLPKDPDGPSR